MADGLDAGGLGVFDVEYTEGEPERYVLLPLALG